jgi:rare lipoprotein A
MRAASQHTRTSDRCAVFGADVNWPSSGVGHLPIALKCGLRPLSDPSIMLQRLLTSGLAVFALSCSSVVVAEDAVEATNATSPAPDGPDSQSGPPAAPAGTVVELAAAAVAHTLQGIVSYYGREFAGRRTASGERFDPGILTMAHKTLAFGTLVKVTNLHNNRSVVVRVNDRGPFVANRVADLSAGAAGLLGMLGAGAVHARLEVLSNAITHSLK